MIGDSKTLGTILIVEDSATQAEALKYILEENQFRTILAGNGEDALALIKQYRPSMVISDIIMPRMNGYEFCRCVKSDQSLKTIPVILLTALSDPQDIVKGLECGADNFITKPYDENYLLSQVNSILKNSLHEQEKEDQSGVTVIVAGQKYTITSGRQHILNLLLSTYEAAIYKNQELERVQNELRKLNEQLGQQLLMLEQAQVLVRDTEGKIIFWNEGAERMYGYTKEEAIGQESHQLLQTIFPKPLKEIENEIWQKGQWEGELIHTRKDGAQVSVISYWVPHYDANNQPVAIIESNTDITERKKAEERNMRQRAIQRGINRLLESALTCNTEEELGETCLEVAEHLTKSKFGFIGKVNSQGLLDDIAISDSGWEACRMKSPDGHGRITLGLQVHGIFGRVIRDGKSLITNHPNSHPDSIGTPEGHVPLTAFLGVPLISGGNTIGMVGLANREGGYRIEDQEAIEALAPVIVEALQRKQAEKQIKHLNNSLKQRALELESANKELESFSYSVSHDLRAPLRRLDGFSHALLEDYFDKLDDQGKDYLRRIRSSSQLMARLIDDILTLSRVARAEINMEEMDLSELVLDVTSELNKSQPERQVEFNVAPGLKTYGDKNLLRLVLENLLGNAFKFTGKSAHALIEFGVEEVDGRHVFFIRDNGAGFDMAYIDKLFKPFQRLHSEADFPGTGIGLASVQRIINRHGGRVWAKGECGKGATFYFTLGR